MDENTTNNCNHCKDTGKVTNSGILQGKNNMKRTHPNYYYCPHCSLGSKLRQDVVNQLNAAAMM